MSILVDPLSFLDERQSEIKAAMIGNPDDVVVAQWKGIGKQTSKQEEDVSEENRLV